MKKREKISLHRKKECAERGQQSSLFEMSVLGALQCLRCGPTPSTILISCLTKILVPHGRGKKRVLSHPICSMTSKT